MFEIIRWSTFLATTSLVVVGYTDQLRLIFFHQDTTGLSLIMMLLSFWTWLSYTLYGYFQKDRKIFWPNLLGTAIVGLILLSFFFY